MPRRLGTMQEVSTSRETAAMSGYGRLHGMGLAKNTDQHGIPMYLQSHPNTGTSKRRLFLASGSRNKIPNVQRGRTMLSVRNFIIYLYLYLSLPLLCVGTSEHRTFLGPGSRNRIPNVRHHSALERCWTFRTLS
jgi:hypothetical protein